ncbi:MAG: hypothetical protein S0880_37160 [Actinomycetota bacterium]|nr:hypothetical protein [Actinomycetota bacterium]
MARTTSSNLTLVTGLGRVPVTRSQISRWRQRIERDHTREASTRH